MKSWWTWLLCVAALMHPSAHADSRSASYSVWNIADNSVTVKFLLPVDQAMKLTGSDIPLLTSSKLAAYLLQHLGVQAAGRDCGAIDQGYDIGQVDPLAVGADQYGFEIVFHCTSMSSLVLRDSALFERLAGHVNFAQIEFGSHFYQQLFTAGSQQLTIADAAPARYLALGFRHSMLSADRWCFLIALVLLLRGPGQLGRRLLALGIGYSLAIAASSVAGITPRLTALDAALGVLVMLLALLSVAQQLSRPRLLAWGTAGLLLSVAIVIAAARGLSPALVPLGAALVALTLLPLPPSGADIAGSLPLVFFGLLDGLVLPAMLAPLQLPASRQIPMQLAFDVGALLLEGVALAAALVLLQWWRRRALRWPGLIAADVTAAAMAAMGMFWMISRLSG